MEVILYIQSIFCKCDKSVHNWSFLIGSHQHILYELSKTAPTQYNQYQRTKQTIFCVLVLAFPTLSGICPVNKNTIDYLLSQNGTGNAVIIVVGGAAESLQCAPGMNSVTLKNRKGFVKLALQKGWVDGHMCSRHRFDQVCLDCNCIIRWAVRTHWNE